MGKNIPVLIVAAALAASASAAWADEDQGFERPYWLDRSVIEAVGRAQQEFMPDRAAFSVTFTETEREAGDASAAAADRARLAAAAIRSRGGADVEIASNVSMNALYREYRDRDGVRQSTGREDQIENYVASVTLNVTIKDVARAADARAAALAVGPENTSALRYWLQNSVEEQRRVYLTAAEDAAARARGAAAAAGARLGPLLALQEGQGPCMGSWQGGAVGYGPPPPPPPPPAPMMAQDEAIVVTGYARGLTGERQVELRLEPEEIDRLRLPSDLQPITLSSAVCAVYAASQ
jgi:hypothetical protein